MNMAMAPNRAAITTRIAKFLFVFIVSSIFLINIMPPLAEAIPVVAPEYKGPGLFEPTQATQAPDIMSKIALQYKEKTERWATVLVGYASILFGAFLTLDIIIFAAKTGIKMASGGEISLGGFAGELFLMVLLPAAFIWTVMQYHQPWSQEIVQGFLYVAQNTEPALGYDSESFFLAGLHLFSLIFDSIKVTSPSTWFLFFAGIIILLCYTLISLQVLLVTCECYIVLSAGVLILGFGAFSMTRQYAINFLQYILSVSIKLFVMQLMIGLGFSFVQDFMKTTTAQTDVATVIGGSIVLLGLIRCIPDICSGIIHGQHVGTGSALAGAVSTVGAGVMGLLQTGAAATGAPGALKAAGASALAESGGNPLSTAGRLLKNLAGAATDAAGITGEGAAKTGLGRFNSKLAERAMRSRLGGGQ